MSEMSHPRGSISQLNLIVVIFVLLLLLGRRLCGPLTRQGLRPYNIPFRRMANLRKDCRQCVKLSKLSVSPPLFFFIVSSNSCNPLYRKVHCSLGPVSLLFNFRALRSIRLIPFLTQSGSYVVR